MDEPQNIQISFGGYSNYCVTDEPKEIYSCRLAKILESGTRLELI